MSKGKKEAMPELTSGIKEVLRRYSKSRSESASLVNRARIILQASEGKLNTEISKTVLIHSGNVGKWRQIFIDAYSVLREIEETAPEKLEGAVKGCLSDMQRSGHPMDFTQEQITQIIKLACTNPADAGYEMSHWSLSALVREIKKQGIAETISEKTVSRGIKTSQGAVLASFE